MRVGIVAVTFMSPQADVKVTATIPTLKVTLRSTLISRPLLHTSNSGNCFWCHPFTSCHFDLTFTSLVPR